jgi:4,4'-diaponeurosporenoate glycosyltransferase
MHVLLAACIAGLLAGLLLLRNVPLLESVSSTDSVPKFAVIIPARNEEKNLPELLRSLHRSKLQPTEILVIDDDSTDNTAQIARAYKNVCVRSSTPLPAGAIGKSWACAQGAASTSLPWLLFLDADTSFVTGGLDTLAGALQSLSEDTALSILPFHRMQRPYEQLSLFFNLLTAIAATGFGKLDRARLVGPSLLIHRSVYQRAGGHSAVQHEILENFHFAERIYIHQGNTLVLGGRGVLETRMFPDGFEQLCESWRKSFAAGAGATSPHVLALSIVWLSAAITAPILIFRTDGIDVLFAAAIYILFVVQIAWLSRQIGTFRRLTAILYPIPLIFYFLLFGQSLWSRLMHRPIPWRGRSV